MRFLIEYGSSPDRNIDEWFGFFKDTEFKFLSRNSEIGCCFQNNYPKL